MMSWVAFCLLASVTAAAGPASSAARGTNVIVILVDDMGLSDLPAAECGRTASRREPRAISPTPLPRGRRNGYDRGGRV